MKLPAFLVMGGALLGPVLAASPIVPSQPIELFNGKDLSTFYIWLADYGHADPHRVFSVEPNVDGAPAIHITGQDMGGLMTRETYANYRLVAEYRWGKPQLSGPRKGRARDSGILLHGQGEDGNALKDFHSPWLRSIEYQIIEGGVGDIILVNGYDRGSTAMLAPHVRAAVVPGPLPRSLVWSPAGTVRELSKGRIDWQFRDPHWQNVAGFRGAKDVDHPVGEWNRIEAICAGGHLVYSVNGVKVNEVTDSTFQSGKLLVQSEVGEIYFRRIELDPLAP